MTNNKPRYATPEFEELWKHTHAVYAIISASHLERGLRHLLELHMPKITKRLSEKLFTGLGPLSSFSAKIDTAYALDLIPAQIRRNLHVIREIRNKFAHSDTIVHFDAPPLDKLFKKFPDNDAADRFEFWFDRVTECSSTIQHHTSILAKMRSLKKQLPRPDTSPDKSK